jgi:hypothetical protein
MEVNRIATLEVVSPRNPVLAKVSVAQGNQRGHECLTGLKIWDSHRDIKDGLGGNARDGGAANVLNINRTFAENLSDAQTLLCETFPHSSPTTTRRRAPLIVGNANA